MTRVAVIGAGSWGRNLVRAFADLGVLAAVAEPDEERRRMVQAEHPEAEVTDDCLPLLAPDSGIDAVVIATPAQTHGRIARGALLAGKDVFVEKPLTLSAEGARTLHSLAEERGRILMVGHLLLYQPAVQWMKSYLADGNLGRVYSLHQRRAKLGRVRSVENVLWSFGVHDIAVLLHLVGSEPVRIDCTGHAVLPSGVEDDVHLHLAFPQNIQAHLHVSWLWPAIERQLTVVGERGMLVYDELFQTVTFHRKTADSDLRVHDKGSDVVFRGSAEPLPLECRHFLDCVQQRRRPLSDGENGYLVVKVLETAMERMREQVRR